MFFLIFGFLLGSGDDEAMEVTSGDEMGSEKGSSNGRRVYPEDEVPWGSLASFALFKLFAEWKTQGSVIPPAITPPLGKQGPKKAVSVACSQVYFNLTRCKCLY